MIDSIIKKMRDDFEVVAPHQIELGLWDEEMKREVNAAIKEAIARKDHTLVLLWARWLSDIATWALAYQLITAPAGRAIADQLNAERNRKVAGEIQ